MFKSQAERSFQRQILLGYGVAMALTVLVLAWGLVSLLRLGEASDAILRENYRSILAGEKMRQAVQRQETTAVYLLISDNREVVQRLSASEQQFELNLAMAKDNITVPGEADVLADLERAYNEYRFEFLHFVQLPRTDSDAGLAYYQKNLQPQAAAIEAACDRLLALNEDEMVSRSERAGQVAKTAVWSVVIVGVAAVLAGAVFSLVLAARIARPVRELVLATQRIAAGDYEVRVEGQGSREFATLADNFNSMVAELRAYNALRVGEMIAEKNKTEAILETIDDGIIVVGGRHEIASVNPAARKALDPESKLPEAASVQELVSDEALIADIDSALESGEPVQSAERDRFLKVRRGKQDVYYEYSITPVASAGDQPLGVVVVLRNVTRLRQLDRLKSEFVMTASHELRTPLTSIEMSVHLLNERAGEKLDASERELLDVAREEVARLKQLVSQLLDLTSIESGKIEMHIADVAPRVLLENAVEPFRPQAENESVELVLDVSDDLPSIRVDANKIIWVITNLVGNALRYTPAGGHIWLSAQRAGRWAHVYVRDDGAGIPHDKQAAIFDKFVQVEGYGPPGGAGLGLAISKEIVRAHGGTIWVESEPGKGSLFTLALPL